MDKPAIEKAKETPAKKEKRRKKPIAKMTLDFAKWLLEPKIDDKVIPSYTIPDRMMERNTTRFGEGFALSTGRGDITDFTLRSEKERRYIEIPDRHREGHFLCIGTTRVGKTRVIENVIEADINKGYNVVIIDPKIDHSLFEKVVQVAAETGRMEDLILVNPIYPDLSSTIDPLSHHYMLEELVSHLVSGVSEGKEPYFKDVARSVSLAVVEAFSILARYERRPLKFNLNDVKNSISQAALKELMAQVQAVDDPELMEDAKQVAMQLYTITNNPPDYFSKISNGLAVALQELTAGNIGKIIGKAVTNRFITRLEEGKRVIVVIHLGSLLTHRAGYTLGKVILSMIQSFVGRRYSSKRKINPQLTLIIDEFQNVLYRGIDDLFAKAGGAGVCIHGFCQSISQIYAALGEDYGNVILDNTNTKMIMRVPDPATAQYVARYFGKKKVYSPFFTVGGPMGSREAEEDVVAPSDALTLKAREFFLHTYGGAFKGKTAEVSPLWVDVKFPDINVGG